MFQYVWDQIPLAYGDAAKTAFTAWHDRGIPIWPPTHFDLTPAAAGISTTSSKALSSFYASIDRAISYIASCMGWHVTRPDGSLAEYIPLQSFSIRFGTSLQLRGHWDSYQVPRISSFLRLCCAIQAADPIPPGLLDEVQNLFSSIWKLKIDNSLKEVWWRLVYNALPIASRMPSPTGEIRQCDCGQGVCDPLHIFWNCPVAKAIVQEINSYLPSDSSLSPASLWLMRPPSASIVHPYIFQCVCLAAISAMYHGSRALYTIARQSSLAQPAGDSASARPAPSRLSFLRRASFSSKVRFYSILIDIATLGLFPRAVKRVLSHESPFIYLDQHACIRAVRPTAS